MKNVKVVALVAIILFLTGCMPKEYTFPNKGQTVEQIELLYNPQADVRDVGGLWKLFVYWKTKMPTRL